MTVMGFRNIKSYPILGHYVPNIPVKVVVSKFWKGM